MAKYGPGLRMGQCFAYDKERIIHALKGELLSGEGEQGFEYAPAGKEECEKYILDAFDNAVYHALTANASGRALESIINKHGFGVGVREYMEALEHENEKFPDDYPYGRDEEGED